VNQPPQANDDSVELDEDAVWVIRVLENDTDPEGSLDLNSLSIVIEPLHGTATVVTQTIVYMPVTNYFGNDTFTYEVCDLDPDPACSRAIVSITVRNVNDPPVARDDTVITNEDNFVNIPVLANDTDVDNDSLSINMVGTPASGSVSHDGSSITYTPDLNFYGQDSFSYVVSDGNLTDTGTVSVTVLPVNDAPVAVDDSASTAEDSPEDIPVLLNDFDVDGDPLTVVVGQPDQGGTTTTSEGSVRYIPFINFNGTEVFTYTISDGQASDTATVTVTVIPINDRPTAVNDVYSTNIDTELIVDPADPTNDYLPVLANDRDPDGPEALTAGLVSPPSNGTLQLNRDGSFIYTPNLVGLDTFTYEANDGAAFSLPATVTINVTN
jgi:hypothetical protein